MITRLLLIAGLLLAALPAAAGEYDYLRQRPDAKDGYAYPECYCRNRGVDVPMGGETCIRVDGREYTARCGMSTNNPAWRYVEDGCEPDNMSLIMGAAFPAI